MERIISIIGPTAAGKKEIARILVDKYGNRIYLISCDSRKIYKYMDIGTAKPPPELRKYYSLIDIKNPDESFSAGEFAREAEKIIESSKREGKIPVIIGGTPLYYKALFEGFFEEPEKKKEVRETLLKRLEEEGVKNLYEELKRVDPEAASKIHPNDWIRITRALEVYYTLKIPISEARKKLKREPRYRPLFIGLSLKREILYRKINERTKKMFEEGLVEETERILEMGYAPSLPSLNTIGYKEVIEYLEGKISLEEAIRRTAKRTRIYSRRQEYFFKSFENVKWFDISKGLQDVIGYVSSLIEEQARF